MIPTDLVDMIHRIHAAPQRLVYSFTGAGSLALWWLHSVSGSSRTILEAIDCYALSSLTDLIGIAPMQAVSPATTTTMASRAYERAQKLVDEAWPLLGIGCSAAIATDRNRRGADRAILTIQTADQARTFELLLNKSREREEQEMLISRLIILAIAQACGLIDQIALDLLPDERLGEL